MTVIAATSPPPVGDPPLAKSAVSLLPGWLLGDLALLTVHIDASFDALPPPFQAVHPAIASVFRFRG